MGEDCELLFFDTFSHETSEELNLDLVQFPRPVYIYEIRIIPLGARVQADFPGGFRLGATNPSSFKLEFFVNDLSKRSACTFERLGCLEYKQNVDIQFPVPNKIPTDGLVLRGWYSAVTLAVYGVLTKPSKERTSPPPPPPPPQPVSRSQPLGKEYDRPGVDASLSVDWEHQSRSVDSVPEPPPPPVRAHPAPVGETLRFPDVSPMVLQQTESHPGYVPDINQNVYSEPPPMAYAEHVQTSVPPAAPSTAYASPYDVSQYTKPWPPPAEQYPREGETYDGQAYSRSDANIFKQSATVSHSVWDSKDCCMTGEVPDRGHDHDSYSQSHSRDKDILLKDRDRERDRPWDRDSHSDYKDDEQRRDYKRKDRDHKSRDRSWERGIEPERYRDRERDKEKDRLKDSLSVKERDREKERGRDRMREKSRDRDIFMDHRPRVPSRESSRDVREPPIVKRPATPPLPQKSVRPRTPQSPPDQDKTATGPRTPKEEEPGEIFEEGTEDPAHMEDFFDNMSPDHIGGEPMYNLSEGEIQDGENTEEDDGYEEIVSEEEDMSDGDDRVIDMVDIDYDLGDETWNYMSSFSPYHCDFSSPQHFDDPTLSPFEVSERKRQDTKDFVKEEKSDQPNKLLEILNLSDGKEHNEKWVDTLESLNMSVLTEGLLSISSEALYDATVDKIIQWLLEALNFNIALKQLQTTYKVRHLKAGIRLATILFQTNYKTIKKLLDLEVPRYLLELFNQAYMTLPVKLLIVRALDSVTYTKLGMEFVLWKTMKFHPPKRFYGPNCSDDIELDEDLSAIEEKSVYQKLLEILMSKQLTRAVVSVSALMQKIHLYEVLQELRGSVEKVVLNTNFIETKISNEESLDLEPQSSANLDMDSESGEVVPSSTGEAHTQIILECLNKITSVYAHAPKTVQWTVDSESGEVVPSSTGEAHTQIILECLNKITSVYAHAPKTVTQPLRYLPAITQYEIPQSPFDSIPGLLRMFKENQLLESVFVLLSSPALAGHIGVLSAIRELFSEFVRTQKGMLFLLSVPDAISGIHGALLQTVDEAREDSGDENISQNLGMQLAYNLQVLLYIDCLLAYHSRGGPKKELDDPEAVSALHHMYTMIFSPIGRQAVVNILAMEQNLTSLLPFVEMTGEAEVDTKLAKSVCTGYVTELLMLIVHCSENVPSLEKFSETLFNLSQQEATPKLHDLSLWMAPTQKISTYTYESVNTLISILKSHEEDAATLPPELITALRILQYATVSQGNDDLKYKYAVIQVFSSDGMTCFITILQHICETFLKPYHQSSALVGYQGSLVVSIIKPIICMIKSILSYLILCLGTEFKDLTAVPVLLQVYSVMSLIPSSSFSYQITQMVQGEIIETLLAFTQPCLGPSESEEALSKSLWTQMVQEVLKFVMQSPNIFVVGLNVLSELLPLPLPLQTREALSAAEVSKMVNNRKLWSAHLHSLSSTIQEVIINLAASSCHPLQQLLRRICVQLADLAAPTALVVVRSVLDALLDTLSLPVPISESKDSIETPPLKPCSLATARIFNLIAYLVSHASFKIPLMHVLRGSVKADERYIDVLTLMLNLLNLPSEKQSHIQSQECVVSILQSLCDPDVGFVTFDSGTSVPDVLSSCLPAKDQMSQICGALIQHTGNDQHNYASILPSLRSLVMLTEHDYGFYYVRQGLEHHPKTLFSLFTRLSTSFSKDSSDCLSTLSTTLEFLRLMVNGYEDGAQMGRTLLLSSSELVSLLIGKAETSKEKHEKGGETKTTTHFLPLIQLEKFLTECANDEEAVESLLESVSGLIQLLNEGAQKDEKPDKEMTEPVLPPPESLSAQFASRLVFMVGDVEEGRLSPTYWLSVPGVEDTDQEQEQVAVDLVSMAESYISGDFDLKSSLESLCMCTEDVQTDTKAKKKGLSLGKRPYQPLVNPGIHDPSAKKPFIAPMRGRGFSRSNAHSSRANDPFRSRPPNTSRPPSMHVDDFVALESHHSTNSSQPTAKRPAKDNIRGRGRGFERGQIFTAARGGGNGGRFFSPPGPYGRRDSNRGGNRGTSRVSSNAWGNRTNSNSSQKAQTGTSVRSNFGGRGRTNNYNVPFGGGGDNRQVGQRNRDPYNNDIGLPPSVVPVGGRFTRGVRTGNLAQQTLQGHWQDNRNKAQNGRFITTTTSGRGGGRRDMNTRHLRSFTR